MTNGWYYGDQNKRFGPFSPSQLKDLADRGTILPIDTVWKDGVAEGVSARRVKNLFPPIAPVTPPEVGAAITAFVQPPVVVAVVEAAVNVGPTLVVPDKIKLVPLKPVDLNDLAAKIAAVG